MTACEVHPLSCDQKIVCAKNSSINDDHGERCHHSGPFLKSMPITWHQNYMKLCGEVSYSHESVCPLSKDEKNGKAWPNGHFSWKMRTSKSTKNYRSSCYTMLLYPPEWSAPWLFLYWDAGWRKIAGIFTPEDHPQRNLGLFGAWRCSSRWHYIAQNLIKIDNNNAGNAGNMHQEESGDTSCLDIAAWGMLQSKVVPHFPFSCTHHWNIKKS
jgi:hypothetical protein